MKEDEDKPSTSETKDASKNAPSDSAAAREKEFGQPEQLMKLLRLVKKEQAMSDQGVIDMFIKLLGHCYIERQAPRKMGAHGTVVGRMFAMRDGLTEVDRNAGHEKKVASRSLQLVVVVVVAV